MAVNRVSVEAIDPLGKSLGVANDFGITPRASDHRAPGAASCGFVQRGAGPLSCQRQDTHRRWVAEGIGAVDGEKSVLEWTRMSAARNVGDGECFEGAGERSSQSRHLGSVPECEGRRRGWLGGEAAVSVLQEVSRVSGCGRVVASSLLVNGSRPGAVPDQGSLSNYRLKLSARGRPSPESRRRSRTAA